MEERFESAVASGDTDSCIQTHDDYVRCSEQLKKIDHEMEVLKNEQVTRIRTILEEQQLAMSQTKKEHRASLLSKLHEDSLSPSDKARVASITSPRSAEDLSSLQLKVSTWSRRRRRG